MDKSIGCWRFAGEWRKCKKRKIENRKTERKTERKKRNPPTLRLNITVDQIIHVTVIHGRDNLAEEAPGLLLVDAAVGRPPDVVEELPPSRVLHD